MTEMDSDQTDGTPSIPSGGSSSGQGDSGGSFDAKSLQASFEALTKRLDEVDARSKALQGDKDRAVTKTKADVDELKRKFAEVEKMKKSGLDEDAAFEEVSFREEVRAVRDQLSKLNPAQPQPAGNGEGKAVNAAEVIKKYALDGSDPEVIERIFRQDFSSPQELELAALKIAYQRAKPNEPNPAAALAQVGATAKTAGLDDLTKQYQNDMLAARGNRTQIIALKEKFKKLGVPVENVVFT